jgi:CBS domain-containing protein
MEIRDSMKKEVVSISASTTVEEAITTVLTKKVGTLPVVDAQNHLLGVVSIGDLMGLFLPDFVSFMEDIDFVRDYGALEIPRPEEMAGIRRVPVEKVMSEPVAVEEGCGPIRALSLMEKHHLQDLPVVKEGKLVGIVSRVDIFRQLFGCWDVV